MSAKRKPWAWAIETPGGDMYDGEYAVFGDESSCRDQVETLNDEIPDGEPMYKMVPLFRKEQHYADLREVAEMAIAETSYRLAEVPKPLPTADSILDEFREKKAKVNHD